eukprot:CAMPEP_0178698208 /NCGR_PEP_ID=MMETSP0699-20121125/10404_1 /TAXON_ID=265572 /ORGANISM="Extubocellulus spinifer, Strain CCMP396" /LENGTH=222 /DNA_ID=CAMNT_0020344233 /DNA_START=222 /DNA_END=890 /DNA_ORIENTATION=+
MENTGMYKMESDDTMYHGETNKQSSPWWHGIAGWHFSSFCNGDNPEPAKNPAFVPGIASLTGAAYGIGHAPGWLGGVVSGLVGVGAWHVLSSLEGIRNDTRDMTNKLEGISNKLERIRNDRKDMTNKLEGITKDRKDMRNKVEGIRNEVDDMNNVMDDTKNKMEDMKRKLEDMNMANKVGDMMTKMEGTTKTLSDILAHLEARGAPEMPGTFSGSSDDGTST